MTIRTSNTVTFTVSPAVPSLTLGISGRYLTSNGLPLLISGDTPWSMAVQLSNAQIDTYLNDRASRGFTAVLFNAIEHKFSSQSPAYKNAAGQNPFTTMSPVAWQSPNSAYWSTVDYIVNGCQSRGMVCFIAPAYFGFNGSDEGWLVELSAASAANLQAYGVFLANRYTQGNVVWVAGGDYAGDSTQRTQQYQIITGMRTVRSDIVTGHPARSDGTAYPKWNGYAGFALNSIYIPATNIADDIATTAYAQAVMPFVMLEGGYEGSADPSGGTVRRAAYTTILSGGAGHFMGNNPLWGFGEPNNNGGLGAASALSTSLNTTAAGQMAIFKSFFTSFQWQRLVPKRDTSLVTSSLGTSGSTARICPALSSDGTFAMVWTVGSNVTVNMAALGVSSVRARWFNPITGTYSTDASSPLANTGTHVFTVPGAGDYVLVLDADQSSVPSYMQGLADFEVRKLTGSTYGPANGLTTLAQLLATQPDPTWATSFQPTCPTGWTAPPLGSAYVNGGHGMDAIMGAWCGGRGDAAGYRLFVHGGGHGDGDSNGLMYFDFSDVGGKPAGWKMMPNSLSRMTAVDNATAAPTPGLYADNYPASTHTYDGAWFDPIKQRYYKYGGAMFKESTALRMCYYDIANSRWSTAVSGTFFNPITSIDAHTLLGKDDGSKLFAIRGSGTTDGGQIIDANTGTTLGTVPNGFRATTGEAAGTNVHIGGPDTADVWMTIGWESGQSYVYVITINWTANTVSPAVRVQHASHATYLTSNSKGGCLIYDSVKNCVWMFAFARHVTTDPMSDQVLKMDLAAGANQYAVSVGGTLTPAGQVAGSTSGMTGAIGGFNRHVFFPFPNYRIVGLVHHHGAPMTIFKLPN